MSEETIIFNSLLDDNFGVLVENEMDEKRLLWLVNQIGESKLRKSAAKRNKYYPDNLLFVSTILKRFHLTVPPSVYTEVSIPVYWVYVLVLRDHSALKVGMTGRWPGRAYSFVKTANYTENFDDELIALFDTEMSLAFPAKSKRVAMQTEREIAKIFAHAKAQSPYKRGLISYGCGGHTEWYNFSIYCHINEYLTSSGSSTSLNASLSWKKTMQEAEQPEHNN